MKDPGSTFAEASRVKVQFGPSRRKPSIIKGAVSSTDIIDTYRFNLKNSSEFGLSLFDLKKNVDVTLFDRKGKVKGVSQNKGKNSEFIETELQKGVYYVQVERKNGKTRYKLQLSSEELEIESKGKLKVKGVSEDQFNPVDNNVIFKLSKAKFSRDLTDTNLVINGVELSDTSFRIRPKKIIVESPLIDGVNHLELYSVDRKSRELFIESTVWAGSQTLTSNIIDENGNPINNATVTAKLGDDQDIQSVASTDAQGQAVFTSVPNRTISLEATTENNRYGFSATTGDAGDVQIFLNAIDQPSPVDNNDFSLGSDGWDIGSAPVEIIQHEEGESVDSSRRVRTTSDSDQDLVVNTFGEGVQSIGRSFSIEPGTKSVSIRYKFITSEVPGGYFGSQFNDFFRVAARSQKDGGFVSDGRSMNALGLGAFDANGATDWRELTLPVKESGDVVQIDVGVANVADGLFDSQLVIDKVSTKKLDIAALDLNDIDNKDLRFLSLAPHTYFGGNTHVNGTISITGSKDDSLKSLGLEVLLGGSVVARGKLVSSVRKSILNKKFGDDEKIEINASQLMFEIPSSQGISTESNVTLRVKAEAESGETVVKDFGSLPVLTRYTGNNRYGKRDALKGGDDWVNPNVLPIIQHFSKLTIGDISNMNGGAFPPHKTHQDGTHVDAWFPGYNSRNAKTAKTMINYLNDPTYGSTIRAVYVTFSKNGSFAKAIKDVVLNDGRKATDVIKSIGGHTTHFHWSIRP